MITSVFCSSLFRLLHLICSGLLTDCTEVNNLLAFQAVSLNEYIDALQSLYFYNYNNVSGISNITTHVHTSTTHTLFYHHITVSYCVNAVSSVCVLCFVCVCVCAYCVCNMYVCMCTCVHMCVCNVCLCQSVCMCLCAWHRCVCASVMCVCVCVSVCLYLCVRASVQICVCI